MELPEILERMSNPEGLIDPNDIVILNGHIGGFITDYELQYDEVKMAFSFKWEEVKYTVPAGQRPLTDKLTEIKMMRDPVYVKLNKIKRTLGELKRYRSDLNRRLDVIMGIKRRS